MNVENLKCLIEKVPGDYDVLVKNVNVEIHAEAVEIDVENKKIILK